MSAPLLPQAKPLRHAPAIDRSEWMLRCRRELQRLQPSLTDDELRFLTEALVRSAGCLAPEQAAWFGWISFLGDHLTPRIGA
jgi:hypothetical protein